MRLRILLPTEVLVDAEVTKVIAEAANGSFCLEPRHIDFVAGLVPGVLIFSTGPEDEQFVGLDEGVLVKCGSEVLVSAWNRVRGHDLSHLRELVEESYLVLDEQERRARTALARLEAGTLRGLKAVEDVARG
jgi:F-type H+-transporting ATPase subunit epsilon